MWNPNINLRPNCSRADARRKFNSPWYNKRKIEADLTEDLPPPKMLITEEKMVSQLKGIHLSKEYTSHGKPGPSNVDLDMEDTLTFVETSSLPTLVVCDEIRELQNAVDSSPLPIQFLDNFKRPTNALVLWRPPAGDLGKYLMNLRDSRETEDTTDEKELQQSTTAVSGSDVDMDDDNNNVSTDNDFNGFLNRTI